jgi:hypothetical protein
LPYTYGLCALAHDSDEILFHAARGAGHDHMYLSVPGRPLVVVMLSNSSGTNAGLCAMRIVDGLVGSRLADDPITAMFAPAMVRHSVAAGERQCRWLEDWSGAYYSPDCNVTYEVAPQDGHTVVACGRRSFALNQVGKREFRIAERNSMTERVKVTFDRESNGQAVMTFDGWGLGRLVTRRR